MEKTQLPFEIFEEIVETADLFLVEPGESAEDSDGISLRPRYQGRWYADGFGIVADRYTSGFRFMAAAGAVAARREEADLPSFDADELARATVTDSMGFGVIVYWSGWEVTDLPGEYTA